ncbi:protein ALP1-like isoform X2 [Cimex lectularius]|uniref:DDE Tnp4 domain-containing protein n=1 Tax=Cimex lectularius TaxID=79782 RepID=A0A8I6SV63_CIMLE|nr:protein ALP1-like isoform X2 [Cimex lectularius]
MRSEENDGAKFQAMRCDDVFILLAILRKKRAVEFEFRARHPMSFQLNPVNLFLLENSAVIRRRIKRRRSKWVHEINQVRSTLGEYHHLYRHLREDEERFCSYFRMSPSTFDYILSQISTAIQKQDTNFRMAIPAEEKLMVTIRYLAHGMSFRSLAHSFRLGVTTIASCVHDTCAAVSAILGPLHLPVPTVPELEEVARLMFDRWNFPNCVGAVDAVADANYKFLTVDIGAYGKQSDGGTFRETKLCKNLMTVPHNWPKPKEIPGTTTYAPFVLVGDEAFPLMENLMRPFPGTALTEDRRRFNKRLSRSRTVVERAFGIMTNKWRILRKEIETSVQHADHIVHCICVLHNIVIDKDGPPIATLLELEQEIPFLLSSFQNDRSNSSAPRNATNVREAFKTYFNNNPM